jgi:hypothetical protein
MRVTCETLDDFIEDLRNQGSSSVHQNMVRVSTSRRDMDDYGARFMVTFQASAVVCPSEGGDYLLQVGIDCGVDYEDATREKNGTEGLVKLKERLKSFCGESGLKVGPGVIEI